MTSKIKKYIYYFYNIYINTFNLNYRLFYESLKIDVLSEGISFFGYYLKSPENLSGQIIFQTATNENTRQSVYESSPVYLLKDNFKSLVYETKAWNWQQGSMLQWLPNNRQFIINDFDNLTKKYFSIIVDVKANQSKIIDLPIYSVSSCGNFALTLSFDRLNLMRPDYAYFNKPPELIDDDKDGIWKIDLLKNTNKLILSIEKLKDFQPVESMKNAKHKFNHIDISPDSKRFIFLHRWIGPKGRFTRLISCDVNGENLCLLNGDKMTSHCCWLNENQILSFCYHNSHGNGYYLFNDLTDKTIFFNDSMPKIDGHPTICPNKKWVVTDSYPGRERYSNLYLFNVETKQFYTLGEFYQPARFTGEKRIDLHPKWNADGSKIYFESGHNGKRQLYSIDVKKFIDES